MSGDTVLAQPQNQDDEEQHRLPQPRVPKAPDGGWGWIVVFGSFMIHVITDGVTYSFGIFYDEFLTYFKEGKGRTAWILSILVGVTLCSGPISSLLVNRWGCRVVTMSGAVLASICLVLSIWANSIVVLYFTIGIGTGLGFGLIYLPAIVSVSSYFESKRSLATGIAVCGSGFGTFIFAPIITKLLELFGWRQSMLIIAAIVLTCVFFGYLFKPLQQSEIENEDVIPISNGEAQTDLDVTSSYSNYYLAASEKKEIKRPWSSGEIGLEGTKYGSIPKSENGFITSTRSEGERFRTMNSKSLLKKPDIFYQRSLASITYKSEDEHFDDSTAVIVNYENTDRTCGCLQDLSDILDLSLFKDVIFIIFTMSNFLTSIGFNVPYVYIVSRAKKLGISNEEAGLLLSVIGIANTVGRIILGYLSDKEWVNRLYVYNTSLALCGIATALSCFCVDFFSLVIYSIVFGFTIGAYVGLTSVILVDLLGLNKLTNAFGLLLLFQGIASLIGPPIAGELYDNLKSYDPGFYVAGFTITLSGLILFSIPIIQKWRTKKQQANMYNF